MERISKATYRPITCLILVWNLLKVMHSGSIYDHLDNQKLLLEQKSYRKKAGETHDLLYFNKSVLSYVKATQKNQTIA